MDTGCSFVPSTARCSSTALTELVPVFMMTLTENCEPGATVTEDGEKERFVDAAALVRISCLFWGRRELYVANKPARRIAPIPMAIIKRINTNLL
jgi:hypothetical protein